MLKLNNKGMTTVEILISFILVAIISTSLYTTFSNYTKKMDKETYKLEINTFKNLVTKQIQDDIIKNGLINAQIKEFHTFKPGTTELDPTKPNDIFIVDMELKDHSVRRLAIRRQLAEFYTEEAGSTESSVLDDVFEVYYGTPLVDFYSITSSNYNSGLEKMDFPDIGSGENDLGHIVKDLRITNVIISNESKVLSVFIGFQHIDEGTKHAINIVCPIDYQSYVTPV